MKNKNRNLNIVKQKQVVNITLPRARRLKTTNKPHEIVRHFYHNTPVFNPISPIYPQPVGTKPTIEDEIRILRSILDHNLPKTIQKSDIE